MRFHRRFSTLLTLIVSLFMLSGCNDAQNEYSTEYRCSFAFITTYHTPSIIKDCVVGSDTFCFVSTAFSGVRHVYASGYKTETEDHIISADLERRMSGYLLGANNGLIVGRSSFYGPEIFAFDRACPNCLKAGVRRNVEWGTNSVQVVCPQCNRTYNLMNDGVPNSGGDKLLRYHATYNSTNMNYEVLQVVN